MITNGFRSTDEMAGSSEPAHLGRAVLLRFDAGHPLTALAPAWAGLCGLLSSGGMHLDQRTIVLTALVVLLVEPLLGGLWDLAVAAPRQQALRQAAHVSGATGDAVAGLSSLVDAQPPVLPFGRPDSPASRLLSVLSGGGRGLSTTGWPVVAFLLTLGFALAIASLLGPAPVGVAVAVLLLLVRRRWQTGSLSRLVQALYDLALPWLIGMAALGMLAEHGLAPYRDVFVLVALYAVAYASCLALAERTRLPALLALDAVQIAALALLLVRHETLAVWLLGLALIGQLAGHPALLAGGSGAAYLRRSGIYIVAGMLAAAIALTPALR